MNEIAPLDLGSGGQQAAATDENATTVTSAADSLQQAADSIHAVTEAAGEVNAPAGLDIGGATAEEIALSILAEIVQERRRGDRLAAPPAVQIEEVEGGRFESRIVSPALGACRGNDGKH